MTTIGWPGLEWQMQGEGRPDRTKKLEDPVPGRD
jgi:hypothetical protein